MYFSRHVSLYLLVNTTGLLKGHTVQMYSVNGPFLQLPLILGAACMQLLEAYWDAATARIQLGPSVAGMRVWLSGSKQSSLCLYSYRALIDFHGLPARST